MHCALETKKAWQSYLSGFFNWIVLLALFVQEASQLL